MTLEYIDYKLSLLPKYLEYFVDCKINQYKHEEIKKELKEVIYKEGVEKEIYNLLTKFLVEKSFTGLKGIIIPQKECVKLVQEMVNKLSWS